MRFDLLGIMTSSVVCSFVFYYHFVDVQLLGFCNITGTYSMTLVISTNNDLSQFAETKPWSSSSRNHDINGEL